MSTHREAQVSLKDSLNYAQPPSPPPKKKQKKQKKKQELLSFCLAIIVTYIMDSGLWSGLGREVLAVYLSKKRNERLDTVECS